ncbi:MAG TPA: sporulation protein YqfD [Firmicutes bacterium]|nr:sporulation protein YqfD [Bacillota bacterium]
MLIVKGLRFARGRVRFQAEKGFLERFINLCTAEGLPLWDGRRRGGVYTACTTPAAYRRMHRCARKARVRLRIVEKSGLPFWRVRYRGRVGLAVGAAGFLVVVMILNQFIWEIRISGADQVPEARILQELEALGVREGARRGSLDAEKIQEQMLLRMEELSWIGVNLRGSTAQVVVGERVMPPEAIDLGGPANVVADRAGQIRRMVVYDGQRVVQDGETVLPGQVVVSGLMEMTSGGTLLTRARAEVYASCQETLEVRVPLREKTLEAAGVQRGWSIGVLGKEIHLWPPSPPQQPYKLEKAGRRVNLLGFAAPLTIYRSNYILQQEGVLERTMEEAMAQAQQDLEILEEQLVSQLGKGEILSRQLEGREEEGEYVLTATYLVVRDIARQEPIYTEEEEKKT